jgi:hypothetical protein
LSLQTVITRLAVIAISAVSVLRAGLLFGVPASSILGVSGVGGLTFGLAARDVLSNVMGGTMLAILRPFKVGEEIFVTQGSNFRGSDDPTVSDYLVKEIGWYQTTLEAKDTKPTIVPNGYFLGANVINVTRATARVLILEFRVSYRDREAVPTICETIEAYLRNDEKCDSRKYPVRVNLAGAKADHLAIAVEFHVYKMPLDEHLRERGRLIFEMLAIVEARTTGPAYPTEISLETSLTKFAVKCGGYVRAARRARTPRRIGRVKERARERYVMSKRQRKEGDSQDGLAPTCGPTGPASVHVDKCFIFIPRGFSTKTERFCVSLSSSHAHGPSAPAETGLRGPESRVDRRAVGGRAASEPRRGLGTGLARDRHASSASQIRRVRRCGRARPLDGRRVDVRARRGRRARARRVGRVLRREA